MVPLERRWTCRWEVRSISLAGMAALVRVPSTAAVLLVSVCREFPAFSLAFMARVVRPLAAWLVAATSAEEEEVCLLEAMVVLVGGCEMVGRLANSRFGCGCEKVVDERCVGSVKI